MIAQALGDDVEQQLAVACRLLHALWDQGSPGLRAGVVESRRRQREAVRLFDEFSLPAALFGMDSRLPQLVNRAWRVQLGGVVEDLFTPIAEALRGNEPVHVPEVCVDTRLPSYYAATVVPLRGCLGAPSGAIVVCAEVTDEVIARMLGVPAETLIWSGLVGAGPDWCNKAWRRYVGNIEQTNAAIHVDDSTRCSAALAEATRQRESTASEARLRRATGEYRWHRVKFVVETARWFVTAVDMHDEHSIAEERNELLASARAARADAEQANRLKDEFLAAVSHELRAPVTTMLLWEKVLREQTDSSRRSQALDAIRQSALAQARLVGDLLDVSRAISGKLYIDLRPIGIGTVIMEALEAALPVALAKHIQLSRMGTRTGIVEGDAARLRQVFDNILANAIKFTPPGGSVVLRSRRANDVIVIDIEDTGRGIASEFLERIFEPFYQTEDVLTRRAGGLGLGLAISRQLVELHDGTLTAASPGPGLGSTFTITLPLSVNRRVASARRGLGPMPMLTAKRVLVVDDDAHVREALAVLLQRAGAIVQRAASASAARDHLKRAKPDIIVCDIAMPDEDGYSFIRTLRASGSAIPAIALTAHAMEADARRAREAGFDLHLTKPVNFEGLVTSICGLCDARAT